MKKERKSKHINFKGLLFMVLIIYLLGTGVYYLLSMPVKNIEIVGNKYLSTSEIMQITGLDKYPSMFNISRLKINKELKKNNLVNKVSVNKNYFGKVIVTIKENNPIFINSLTNEMVLSNGSTIENDGKIIGVPILVNYVPKNIYDDLIKGLAKIDEEIVFKISEIEYSPDKSESIVFDEARFLLRMNDGNRVFINTPNIQKLNNYNLIYSEVGSGGTLLLDSNSSNYIFNAG